MANKIVSLVQNDVLRDELHANSYREYISHSWDNSADKLLDLYQQKLQGAAA
jgi:glycosyltransferase involved in cell wall biosynthesis